MADAARRKSLEKDSDSLTINSSKTYCCRCGVAYGRKKGCFPVSHSPMYRGSGFLPICNDCVDNMYEQYRVDLGDDREAMRRMCMKLDLYWSDSIYQMVLRTAGVNSRIRSYIGKTNLIRYIDKTFDDTLREDAEFTISVPDEDAQDTDTADNEDNEIEVDPSLIEFWGKGYKPEFYYELERKYQEWTENLDELEPGERSIYKQICLLEAIINRDSAAGRPIDKNVNTLNSLLGSANLKPTQKKSDDADSTSDSTPFGVWIRRWENDRPIPDPDPELEDVDGIIRYISIWFLGHLCKMLGIKNTYCKLYEDEIAKMRVERPEYEDEDDEALFNDIFGSDDGD